MAKYRTKIVEIEAIKFLDSAERIAEISDWAGEDITIDYSVEPPTLKIHTLEGTMKADHGDYIIKGLAGEFYPCKPHVFHAKYVRID